MVRRLHETSNGKMVPVAPAPPAQPQHPLDRLKYIGFVKSACCNCVTGKLCIEIEEAEHARARNVLYAIVVEGVVKYVGKSTRRFRQRMNNYRTPSKTQKTSMRNHRLILKALAAGQIVEVFLLRDNGLLQYGGFHINLAAGLEDALIRDLKPEWNGKKTAVGSG